MLSKPSTVLNLSGGMGDDDIDVAVFRFTLGIPGFDDRFLPRVVGLVIASALAINNVLGAQPAPDEQVGSMRCSQACDMMPLLPA